MKLIIRCKEWETALVMAQRFMRDAASYHVGYRNGIAYGWTPDRTFYVYRLASGTVVVQ